MTNPDRFALLGLPPLDLDRPFMELFEEHFAHRLVHRADGFRIIFQNLPICSVIVETGCLRALDNWGGDGQSTFLFDLFSQKNNGRVYTIDSSADSLATAEKVCAEQVALIQDDGAHAINEWVQDRLEPTIDLLYLDSFNHGRDVSVIPAPVHYMMEFCAAWPALRPGSIVAIDDFHNSEVSGAVPGSGTKGLGVDLFLQKVGATVLHDGHQKIWLL